MFLVDRIAAPISKLASIGKPVACRSGNSGEKGLRMMDQKVADGAEAGLGDIMGSSRSTEAIVRYCAEDAGNFVAGAVMSADKLRRLVAQLFV